MANAHVTEIHRIESNLQLRYRFSIELDGLAGQAGSILPEVQLRIQNVSPLYKFTNLAEPQPHQNSEWYYLYGDKVEGITLTFFECEDWKVSQYFMLWRQLQINRDGTYNVPEYYKRDVRIAVHGARQIDEGGRISSDSTVRKILYQHCFPETITASEFDYSSSNPMTVEVLLSVDGILIE